MVYSYYFYYLLLLLSYDMQLVTPIDVPMAVRIATTSWMMYFTVSFFVIGSGVKLSVVSYKVLSCELSVISCQL